MNKLVPKGRGGEEVIWRMGLPKKGNGESKVWRGECLENGRRKRKDYYEKMESEQEALSLWGWTLRAGG